MRAFQCLKITDDFSGIALVGNAAAPTPGPGEVLVQVKAASLNFPDVLMCQGKYQFKPEPPFTLGMDLSGIVVGVGQNVSRFRTGDAVTGGARLGAFAEYCVCSELALSPKPESMNWAEAAAYPAAYLTAYVALVRRGMVQAGETVLVHGAAGGVGLAAVDVAKLLGANVIATASTEEKRAFLTEYGADEVLPSKDFRENVKQLTDGRGADVIYDPVGGSVFDESVRCIAFDGRLLVIGFTSGTIPTLGANMPLIKGFSLVGVRAGEYGRQFPDRGLENLRAISEWANAGKLRPHIWKSIPLENAAQALDAMRSRQVIGKAIIAP
jgi:NADPH:quinone reductase